MYSSGEFVGLILVNFDHFGQVWVLIKGTPPTHNMIFPTFLPVCCWQHLQPHFSASQMVTSLFHVCSQLFGHLRLLYQWHLVAGLDAGSWFLANVVNASVSGDLHDACSCVAPHQLDLAVVEMRDMFCWFIYRLPNVNRIHPSVLGTGTCFFKPEL